MVAVAQSLPIKDLIAEHEQKVTAARAGGRIQVATELNVLGLLYRQAGKMQKALDCLNEALPIEQKENNQAAQAMTQNIMGRVYTDMGQEDKALELFSKALPVWSSLGLRQAEANTLNYIAKAYGNLGKQDEALKDLNEALTLWRDIGSGPAKGRTLSSRDRMRDMGQLRALRELNDELPPNLKQAGGRAGEASTLDNLGKTYSDMGQGEEAFKYFNQALPIWREVGEQGGEALTLNNMGRAYADLGQKQNALDYFNQALAIWRAIGNRQGEAMTLNNMGRLYRDLGQQQTALDYYNQALPIWREVESRSGEGLALNDIGRAYADIGQAQKALDYCKQALPIWRETGSRRGEAMTLNNMGRDYTDLGETDKALEFDNQALPIWREVKDRRGEALALMTIGWAYAAQKDMDNALASELAALALAKAAGDPGIEGGIETSLMIGLRNEHHPEEAIFFGMDAVNSFQQIRKNISGLDKDLQAGFAKSKSETYRDSGGVTGTGRPARRGRTGSRSAQGAGTEGSGARRGRDCRSQSRTVEAERRATEGAERTRCAGKDGAGSDGVSVEYAALQAKATRTPDEDARLKMLEARTLRQGNGEVSDFLHEDALSRNWRRRPGAQDANALLSKEKSEVSRLQNTLAELGPRVMGIRLLLGEEHAYAIVVTAQRAQEVRTEGHAGGAAQQGVAGAGRSALALIRSQAAFGGVVCDGRGSIRSRVKALGTEPRLQDERVPTLLWSLDGVMRYVPMAALYDGQHYMVERFNNVLFTPESYGHMTCSSRLRLLPGLRVLAMGLSKSYGGLPALPGVMPELDAVVARPCSARIAWPDGGKAAAQ